LGRDDDARVDLEGVSLPEWSIVTPSDDVPKIKGAVIRDPRDWMRTAYGPEAYAAALSKLSLEDRTFVDGPILATAFYPIEPWDRFQAAMRAEALARRGHNDLQFSMRNMREAGSKIVRGIYKVLLGMLSPESAMGKFVVVYNRVYSEGRCELVSFKPNCVVLRYGGARPAFRTNLTHNFVTSAMFILEMNGAKGIDGRISRDEVVNGKLVFEVTVTYQ
jgi:hypothetical protein